MNGTKKFQRKRQRTNGNIQTYRTNGGKWFNGYEV